MDGTNGTPAKSASKSTLQWKVGLVNGKRDGTSLKYLTAEKFGSKVNVTGTTLKKKQIWTIEQDSKADVVYIRSPWGRYLTVDKHGSVEARVEGTADDPLGSSEQFAITSLDDGKWLLKNVNTGNYFGGTGDTIHCKSGKKYDETETWSAHLAVHPQVNLRNVKRGRYAHLAGDSLHCDELIPWGQDALITIEYHEGLYAVKTSDRRYLHRDGSLVDATSEDTFFRLGIHAGIHGGASAGLARGPISWRDKNGKYLTNVGQNGVIKTKNAKVTADELYVLEDSHPQAAFKAHNNRHVSVKQGVDVTANQDEVTDTETFQIEFTENKKVAFRTIENKYWSLQGNGGIQAVAAEIGAKTLFDFEWRPSGQLSIKASNGNYVTAKMNGSLYATVELPSEKELFKMTIVNRPIIVLRGSHGFVGLKGPADKLECNKATYDMFLLNQNDDGTYSFQTRGKYWSVGGDGSISADASKPDSKFNLEFCEHSKLAIKAENGSYVKGEQNGIFGATGGGITADTLWEY